MTETKESVFETLSKIDVSNHVDVIKMKSGFNPKYVSLGRGIMSSHIIQILQHRNLKNSQKWFLKLICKNTTQNTVNDTRKWLKAGR